MLPRYKDIVELIKKGSTLEAQEQIITLREGALELQEENHQLKQRIKELESIIQSAENWNEEKKRYALVNPWKGAAQVYALRKDNSEDEAAHLVCTNCFEQKRKVILTPQSKDGWVYMVCPLCKANLQTGYRGIGTAKYFEQYTEENG